MGFLPEYPSGRGPGRILGPERLDHLVVTDVMATTAQEALDTVMRRLRKLTDKGGHQVCAPIGLPQVLEKLPGRFTLFVDAYGLDSAELIYATLNGKTVASTNCPARSRTVVKVYGEGPLALCALCRRRGHKTTTCNAPSMYLQCDSNGLDDDFCAFISQVLDGATAVFAGTNPMRKGDKTFGFAIFGDKISVDALAGAAALYTDGVLSHVPRITAGVHACRDCGQLDEDAGVGDRMDAHSSADSAMCGLHRRETLSGRKVRPNTVAPTRATPQFVKPKPTPGARPHGPAALTALPVDDSAAMTDDDAPPPSALAKGPHQPAAPVAALRQSSRPSRPPLKRGRTIERAIAPSVPVSSPRPAMAALGAGLSGAQTDMPPPQARTIPHPLYETVSNWQARMAGGRLGRPTNPPVASAHPPTSGWRDEWTMTDSDPDTGDRVAVVYSMGPDEKVRSVWFLGEVSLLSGSPVACFVDEYNLDLIPEKRLRSLTDTGNAEPGAWCIITRTFP
jgi:hypothetical protein